MSMLRSFPAPAARLPRAYLDALGWTLAAGIVGLLSSAVFASGLRLHRDWFVAAHAVATVGVVAVYLHFTGARAGAVLTRWPNGIVVGLIAGGILVRGVLLQPASADTTFSGGAVVWLGIVYGTLDALLLNVVPVHRLESTMAVSAGRREAWGMRGAALGLSLVATALYHLGFAEFRGPALIDPLVGNAIITASYLISRSPCAAILSHVAMHVAAVVHGMDTTVQLPPHY